MSNKKNVQPQKKAMSDVTKAIIIVITAVVVMAAFIIVIMCLPTNEPVVVNMTDIQSRINSHKVTDFTETDKKTEYVKITVKDHGDIVIALRSDIAPETVKNFQNLVAEGFYDGLTFHRVMKGFMIQGGDPKGDGTGNSDKKIKGEFTENGFENNLKHVRGVISMARGNEMDSASCQFFICDATAAHLDGKYASFGFVMAGMDTVDSIAAVEVQPTSRGENSDPVKDVIIEKIVFVKDNHDH